MVLSLSIKVVHFYAEVLTVQLLHMSLAVAEVFESHFTMNTRHKVPLSDPTRAFSVVGLYTVKREKT